MKDTKNCSYKIVQFSIMYIMYVSKTMLILEKDKKKIETSTFYDITNVTSYVPVGIPASTLLDPSNGSNTVTYLDPSS